MTDNKIIKALECCQTEYNRNCKECPYKNRQTRYISTATCNSKMREDLLDLINRQQAEIARLTEAFENFSTDIDTRDVEDFELIRKVRTDTICEFAERLEKRLANNYEISAIAYQAVIHDVSIVANEMIGELL